LIEVFIKMKINAIYISTQIIILFEIIKTTYK